MVEIKNKAPTKRERLDRLIDWYEEFKPSAGQRIEIAVTPAKLAQILKYEVPKSGEPPREQRYRGRVIVAIGIERPRKSKHRDPSGQLSIT
jgi:hypothetical protein